MLPVEPVPPAVGHRVGRRRRRRGRCAPSAAATRRPSAGTTCRLPPVAARWSGTGPSISCTRPAPAMPTCPPGLEEPGEVVEVEVVGPVVDEGVDRHDRRRRTPRRTAAPGRRRGWGTRRRRRRRRGSGAGSPTPRTTGRWPTPATPSSRSQEDRRRAAPAAQVEHAHPGLQVHRLGQPLVQPQRVRPAAGRGDDPVGVIGRRPREPLADQVPVILHPSPSLVRNPANHLSTTRIDCCRVMRRLPRP